LKRRPRWPVGSVSTYEGRLAVRLGSPFRSRLASPLAVLCVLGFAVSGCSEELGPERYPTTTVSGVVLEGGSPVGGGWLEFIPVEGTVGDMRSARLAPDGSFRADRVAVGENALRLVNAPIRMPQGSRLFGQFSTPVRRVISTHPANPIRIELVDEAVRYHANRPRRPRYEIDFDPASGSSR
jgi:hypothetical protein